MPKIKILFPQITFEKREIEVSQQMFEDLTEHHIGVTDFVWNNMTEQEQTWTDGKKWVHNAIDCGYAGVRKI